MCKCRKKKQVSRTSSKLKNSCALKAIIKKVKKTSHRTGDNI